MNSGLIYKVKNKINGKSYIGMTRKGLHNRKRMHLYNSRKSTYPNNKLHSDILTYGEDNFEWIIIEKDIPSISLSSRETFWISYYKTADNGYNITKGSSGLKGKVKNKEFSENKRKLMNQLRKDGKIKDDMAKLENKLSDKEVLKIRDCILEGNSDRDVARILNMDSPSPVSIIKRGKSFRHIITDEDVYKMSLIRVGLNTETAIIARDLILNGRTLISISKELGVEESTISLMKRGKTFTDIISKKDLMDMNEIMPIKEKKTLQIEEVRAIKELLSKGVLKNKEIAEIFDIKSSVVSNIKLGKRHKNIV